MYFGHLLTLHSKSRLIEPPHRLQRVDRLLILRLGLRLAVHLRQYQVDSSVAGVVLPYHCVVHIERLLQQVGGILDAAGLEVALAEQSQDVCMELLRLFELRKELPINFESDSEVFECLFIVFVVEI